MKTTLHTEDIKMQMFINEVEEFITDFIRRNQTGSRRVKSAVNAISKMIAAYHQDKDLYNCYKSIKDWVERIASQEFAARTNRRHDADYAKVQGPIYEMLESYGL